MESEDDDFYTAHDSYLPDFLRLLQPIGGKMTFFASNAPADEGFFKSLSLNIELEPFAYRDPFYGDLPVEPRSLGIYDLGELERKNLRDPHDFVGFVCETPDALMSSGYFSNSLDIVLRRYAFGGINKGLIDVEITFFITNSDSYGSMTGSPEDHARFQKTVALPVQIEVIYEDVLGKGVEYMGEILPPHLFDLKNARVSEVGFRHSACQGLRYRLGLLSAK
jgi:hypothetical protein